MATDVAVEAPAPAQPARRSDFGSSARLWGGFFGRAWLWFVAGCLVVTFVPMVFGWRPYVVESGSMMPRIHVGDVILSAPEHDPHKLVGHVAIFTDPNPLAHGHIKSHRIISINKDGALVSKGDANPDADATPVPPANVKGMGRLLVRWLGLPEIWLQKGEWVKLALLIGSFALAAMFVVRDRDEESDGDDSENGDDSEDADDSEDGDENSGESDSGGYPDDDLGSGHLGDEVLNKPLQRQQARRSWRLRRARHRRPLTPAQFARRVGAPIAVFGVSATALVVPVAHAALSATTIATGASWSAAAMFGPSYTNDAKALDPYLYWKLDDTGSNNVAIDYSTHNRNGHYSPTPSGNPSWTMRQAGGLVGQTPNYAVGFAGGASTNTTCVTTDAASESPAPNTYSEIIWFKTTSTQGGKLIGFESAQTGVSDSSKGGQYDRHIYMDSTGALWFGAYTGSTTTVNSGPGYNDGKWHMAAATMGTTGGMELYIDDVMVASRGYVTSQNYDALGGGYWRVGCGNLEGWGSFTTQTNYGFAGSLDEATVYTTELSAADVDKLWTDINPRPVVTGLVNGDFETGNIAPWTCTAGSGITSSQTRGGGSKYAVSLPSYGLIGLQAGECDQDVTLLPNHTYTLSGYVKNGTTVGVRGGATGSATQNGNAWKLASFTFTTDATGHVTVYVQGQIWSTTYADDITLS